ncbi:hypothetical protein ACSDQ9_10960 [Aestuariimicrobium soli]|uniref:hypothetical protein n=1 Tax=Aestuariimicrobium soli TaxID=2035834 RepID=UPI003EB8EA1B
MTNLFEIFNPNAAHWRRQRDLDKVAVVPSRNGAQGPMRIDLDKGTIVLPAKKATDEVDASPQKSSDQNPADASPADEATDAADEPQD